jgi:hypothetical protein
MGWLDEHVEWKVEESKNNQLHPLLATSGQSSRFPESLWVILVLHSEEASIQID